MLDDLTGRMRGPRQRVADLRAQLAANRAGANRLRELVDRYGAEQLSTAMDETLDYAERRTRAAIEELGGGERSATDVLEARDGRPGAPAQGDGRRQRPDARLHRVGAKPTTAT